MRNTWVYVACGGMASARESRTASTGLSPISTSQRSQKQQHREKLERAQRQRQEEERLRFEREQERRREAERVRDFEEELRCWRLARDAREYLSEICDLLSQTDAKHLNGSGLAPSLTWIEGFARRIDPLTSLRDRSAPSGTRQAQPTERGPEAVEQVDQIRPTAVIGDEALTRSGNEQIGRASCREKA